MMTALYAGEAIAQTARDPDPLANYRAMTSVAPKPCSKAAEESDIVVCASKLRDSQRVPFIDETRVGDRPRLALGEISAANEAPNRPTHCPIRGCAGDGSLLGAIGKIVERIRD